MSSINTNGIDTNYPVPGKNNSSQGMRDNFSQIKTGLDQTKSELDDLQTKVVVKAALEDSSLNNDMANTLISNASISGFRSTSYNLGNSLSGTVIIDASKADVHYGTLIGNTTLQFGGWSPTNTQRKITLRLNVANTQASISLPNSVVSTSNYGTTLVENFNVVGNIATLTVPSGSSLVEYEFTTLDCGNTISISPVNRGFRTSQFVSRDVPPTGIPGDSVGTVAVSPSKNQIVITSTVDTGNVINGNTAQLHPDLPIQFTGNTFGSVTAGTIYYVKTVPTANTFTISTSVGGAEVNVTTDSGTMKANPIQHLYVASSQYDSIAYSKDVTATSNTGNITLNNTTNLSINDPVMFSGNIDTANTKLNLGQVYYIKTINSGNITVAYSRNDGLAGTTVIPGNKANANITATSYSGSDIFKRTQLTSW